GGMTRNISNLDLIKKMCRLMKKDFASSVEFVKDRPGHDRRYALDWRKIKRQLGWQPKFNFDTWLEKTIKWYRQNDWWWRPLKA
ncbi:dTDP-glucose 4,6-dehydratase, partial [Candidatus Shapirobacteria bacterium CG09_land_8_20_14_0_10_47_13]